MVISTCRIPQPGWTGTRVLRIVQATPRTVLSVDPIGRRSAVATFRSAFVSSWRSMLQLPPSVSMTRNDIETEGAKLAQRQYPRGFEPNDLRCKSSEIRFRAVRSIRSRRKRPIRERCHIDRLGASSGDRKAFRCLVPLSETGSRRVMRQRLSVAGAQTGLTLTALRIESGQA